MEKPTPKNRIGATALAVLFWLLVWQLASMAVNQELFLPSPLSVLRALGAMVLTGSFWYAIFSSLLRIAIGFALGLVLGVLLAWAAAAWKLAEILLRPLMQLVRATPVASFIILALVWISGKNLSVFISFLMVLPVLYSGTLLGIRTADKRLLEMARVFHVGFSRRLGAIYLPKLFPSLLSSCELALGMSWKSGVAAEVIGLAQGSIGEQLYQSKIFLQIPNLFAWTAVIILVSWLFGKVVLALLRVAAGAAGHSEKPR